MPRRHGERTWSSATPFPPVGGAGEGLLCVSRETQSRGVSAHQAAESVLLEVALQQLIDLTAPQSVLHQGEYLLRRGHGLLDLGLSLSGIKVERSIPMTAAFRHLLNVERGQFALQRRIIGCKLQ